MRYDYPYTYEQRISNLMDSFSFISPNPYIQIIFVIGTLLFIWYFFDRIIRGSHKKVKSLKLNKEIKSFRCYDSTDKNHGPGTIENVISITLNYIEEIIIIIGKERKKKVRPSAIFKKILNKTIKDIISLIKEALFILVIMISGVALLLVE